MYYILELITAIVIRPGERQWWSSIRGLIPLTPRPIIKTVDEIALSAPKRPHRYTSPALPVKMEVRLDA